MKSIRILFLGDEGVGKTSIISTIMSETFPKNPPKTLPPVCIPPDVFVQHKDISTLLLDSSAETEEEEIKKASVITLVYDVNNDDTKKRLDSYWLPKIAELNGDVPVILIGNKIDLRPSYFYDDLEEVITPLVMRFRQVEMGIECSAKAYLKLTDVVFCAQRAVLFPIAPLQDPINKELKPDYEKALLRIFRMSDRDADGYLDELEIADMQSSVFSGELHSSHFEGIKKYLSAACREEEFSIEDAKKGINFEAFKCLQKLFIKTMKLQTCWLILEHFGYNEKLRIDPAHLVQPKIKEDEANEEWEGLELSDTTIYFLLKLYENYSSSEGTLNQEGVEDLFEPYPEGCPWNLEDETKVDQQGCIGKKNWIGLWQKEFNTNYEKAFEMLVYLGHIDEFYDTVKIKTNMRISSIQKPSKATVFQCYVIGAESVGKTSFLNMFIREKFDNDIDENSSSHSVVANMQNNNKDRNLILTEVTHDQVEELLESDKMLRYCDCICVMYDGSEGSVNYIRRICGKLPSRIPRVVIKTKSDLEHRGAGSAIDDIAREVKTDQYCEISNKNLEKTKEAANLILNTAINPAKGLEVDVILKLKDELAAQKTKEQGKLILSGVFVASVISLAAYTAYKNGWLKSIVNAFK